MAYITPLAATHEADTSDAHDASAVSILDTATATLAAAVLAVGTDGDVLTADSGEALGVKWAAVSGGSGLTHPQVMARGVIGGLF